MFDFYLAYEYWFAVAQLVTAMLGLGAVTTLEDFRAIARAPRSFSIGLVLQMLLVPLIGAVYIGYLSRSANPIAAGVLIGFAIAVAIPGGSLSNILALLGRGNVALSITLTGFTTLACLVFTPIVIQLLVKEHLPSEFVMPAGRIAVEIFLFLLVPLALGMLALRYLSSCALTLSKWSIRISIAVIVLIVIGALGSGRVDLVAFGFKNALLTFGLYAIVAFAGVIVPLLFGTNREDMVAIQIEVMMRNVNLGLLLAVSLFPVAISGPGSVGNHVFFTILFYGGCQLATGFFVTAFLRLAVTNQRYTNIAALIGHRNLRVENQTRKEP